MQHPGNYLGQLIEQRQIHKSDVANALEISRTQLYNILNGKANITALMAVKLEEAYGDKTAEDWMNIQAKHSLEEVRREQELLKIKKEPSPDNV